MTKDEAFNRILIELIKYGNKYGNIEVPNDYVANGCKLGEFLNAVKNGKIKLSLENLQKLKEIQTKISTDQNLVKKAGERRKFDFDDFVHRLEKYNEKYGDIQVPQRYVCDDGYRLGLRVAAIRSGNNASTDIQKALLNSMGFVWKVDFASKFNFDEFYRYLKAYKKEKGTLKIPNNCVYKGYPIGKKRVEVLLYKKNFTKEQIDSLTNLGFWWGNVRRLDFDMFCKEFKAFKNIHNTNIIPNDYVNPITNYKLGKTAQRIRDCRIGLTGEQEDLLYSMGFVWSIHDEAFKRIVKEYRNYIKKTGSTHVKYKYVTDSGFPLGKELSYIKKGAFVVTDSEKQILLDLGFSYEPKRRKVFEYNDFRNKLIEYNKTNNNKPTSSTKIGDYPFGQVYIRLANGGINLSNQEIAELESEGMVFNKKANNTQL